MSRTIDLHHHVIPGFYWETSNEDGTPREASRRLIPRLAGVSGVV